MDGWRILRAATLITTASPVTGHVLRDAQWRTTQLDRLGEGEDAARHAMVVVALGLLGRAAAPEIPVPVGANPDDPTAWVLGTVLARGEGAAEELVASPARWSGAAQPTL